ncbi:hypothetical protein ID007_004312 [Salmonella enterica]|nr:hypothetical protein [Salmonella enterica]
MDKHELDMPEELLEQQREEMEDQPGLIDLHWLEAMADKCYRVCRE